MTEDELHAQFALMDAPEPRDGDQRPVTWRAFNKVCRGIGKVIRDAITQALDPVTTRLDAADNRLADIEHRLGRLEGSNDNHAA